VLHRTEAFPDVPFFNEDERERITKIYNQYKEKYGKPKTSFRVCTITREDRMDLDKKLRDAELAAGF
jgi:hypothetical protein